MFLIVRYLETRSCFPPQFAVRPRWRVEFSHYVVHCLVFLTFFETFSRLLSGRFRVSLFSMPRDRSDWHFAQDAAFGARHVVQTRAVYKVDVAGLGLLCQRKIKF